MSEPSVRQRLALLPTFALLAACRGTPPPPPRPIPPVALRDAAVVTDAPPTTLALSGSVPFCAYGGQGVLAADANFDDFYRVIAIVDVTAPDGVSTRALTVRAIELLGDGGRVEASMRSVISVMRMPPPARAPTWADSMDARNAPFDGALSPGTTRLRIEAWLTRPPRTMAQSVRIELGAPGLRALLLGPTQGEWPTG